MRRRPRRHHPGTCACILRFISAGPSVFLLVPPTCCPWALPRCAMPSGSSRRIPRWQASTGWSGASGAASSADDGPPPAPPQPTGHQPLPTGHEPPPPPVLANFPTAVEFMMGEMRKWEARAVEARCRGGSPRLRGRCGGASDAVALRRLGGAHAGYHRAEAGEVDGPVARTHTYIYIYIYNT